MFDNTIELINNNNYGAPELKKLYQANALRGFIIAIALHVILIAAYMLIGYINEAKSNNLPYNPREPVNIVMLGDPPSLDNKDIPPVKDFVNKSRDLSALTPLPTKKSIANDVILKTQDELDKINTNVSGEGDSVIASNNFTDLNIDTKIIDKKIDKDINNIKPDKIYKFSEVQKIPECINFNQARSSMKYPEIAAEIGLEGRITIDVLVGTDGSVLKTGKIKGNEIFYEEVEENAVKLKFTPGLQNNIPVKVWVAVPFMFQLK